MSHTSSPELVSLTASTGGHSMISPEHKFWSCVLMVRSEYMLGNEGGVRVRTITTPSDIYCELMLCTRPGVLPTSSLYSPGHRYQCYSYSQMKRWPRGVGGG
jgi:hypothetical protein